MGPVAAVVVSFMAATAGGSRSKGAQPGWGGRVARELLRAGRRLGQSPGAWSRSLGARLVAVAGRAVSGGCSSAGAGASGSRGRWSWRRRQARRGRGAGVAVSGERRPRRGGGPGATGSRGPDAQGWRPWEEEGPTAGWRPVGWSRQLTEKKNPKPSSLIACWNENP
jgi:hypothetical protein